MNQNLSEYPLPDREVLDFPARIVLITHLMTCYAIKPSGLIAYSVAEHMRVLLESTETDILAACFPRFEKLYTHWRLIAAQHMEKANPLTH